jgi:hypothetical protein
LGVAYDPVKPTGIACGKEHFGLGCRRVRTKAGLVGILRRFALLAFSQLHSCASMRLGSDISLEEVSNAATVMNSRL